MTTPAICELRSRTKHAIFRAPGRRRGQILTMTALLIPALLGVTGLSLDIGYIYHIKRRMQTAADAGALGGAHELWRQNSSLVVSAAKNDAGLNGFTDKNATITVNNPPATGARAGDPRFVEVVISQDVPTFFLRIINRNSATVRSRAVAGLVNAASGCVMALNPTQKGALTVQGTSNLTAGCGVMVNSNNNQAIIANGGGCIYAGEVGVTGGWLANGSANCIDPPPSTQVPPAMDPLSYLTPPSASGSPIATNEKISGGSVTLYPGIYSGGITITGGTVTFMPGTYILDGGGLQASGNAILNGAGVTFYNTNTGAAGKWGTFNIDGTVKTDLTAPTSGDYQGVLFWNDKNALDKSPGNVINGTSDSILEGAFYFPSTHLSYSGTSTAANWTMIIADTITVSGNAYVNGNFDASDVPPPTRIASLVE
jgi:Flp pilus assembly protein TadG